jgi:hypothetical protein
MKGPMTTQTLRGLATHGGMHWRGDRVDGFFGTDPCNNAAPDGPCDEDHSFQNFIVAFEGLLGKHGTVTPAQMQLFTDFNLQVFLPPNPVRNLDNSLNDPAAPAGSQLDGNARFLSPASDTIETCEGCHSLDPSRGFFGSGGEQSFEGEPQNAKVPHMRNMYAKIGMFGFPGGPATGEQVRGFGFLHDGSVDTLLTFVSAGVFTLTAQERRNVEQFSLAFPTDLAPIVGQQVTLTSTNGAVVNPRIDLFETRAGAAFTSLMLGGAVTECDLVAKGNFGAQPRGWRRESGTTPANTVYRDDTNQTITGAALRALATSQGPLTYTCAPPGSGTRMGINQDRDNFLDGLDNCPAVANNGQADTDQDGIGDACDVAADSDGDGVLDAGDNCPAQSNPGQEDFDGDGEGDACDVDDDDDGLLDSVETNTGVFVSPTDTGSNPLDADSDDDGIDDGPEVANGTNPNVPNPAAVPSIGAAGQLLLAALMLGLGRRALRRRRG